MVISISARNPNERMKYVEDTGDSNVRRKFNAECNVIDSHSLNTSYFGTSFYICMATDDVIYNLFLSFSLNLFFKEILNALAHMSNSMLF